MFRLPLGTTLLAGLAVLAWPASDVLAQSHSTARVEAVRYWSFGDVTRIAVQTRGDYKLSSQQIEKPARIYFDLTGIKAPIAALHKVQIISVNDRLLKQVRIAEIRPGKTRIVLDLEEPAQVVSSQLVNPDRLMIELRPKNKGRPTVSLAHNTTRSRKTKRPADEDEAAAYVPPRVTDSTSKAPRSQPANPASGNKPSAARSRAPIEVVENRKVKAPDINQAEPSPDETAPAAAQTSSPTATSRIPSGLSGETSSEASGSSLTSSHETLPNGSTTGQLKGYVTPATRDSGGDRSLVRVLGLKLGRVVIDAGHGGHDTGTIGPNGLLEKDLVLDVSLRLGKLLTQKLGAEVIYTRSADVFIPLEERTKIANAQRADLFISIHANSSPDRNATGVETYYFNLTSDKVGLDLATRENASSISSISDLNGLLHKAVLENKLEESREFAQKVQTALWSSSLKMNVRSRDRGIRQAPFVVLIGASMPSILAEIGFVSNAHDERLLERSDQRQKIAEALLKGVSQYAGTLSHVQIARANSK